MLPKRRHRLNLDDFTMGQPLAKNRSLIVALWANAALLAAILVVLVGRSQTPQFLSAAYGQAQGQPAIAGGGGIFVMPAQMKTNVWGCYLLDVDNQTLCAYEYWGGDRLLRLAASREIRHDRRLKRFNTDPQPNEIKAMVEREAAQMNQVNPLPVPPNEPKQNNE